MWFRLVGMGARVVQVFAPGVSCQWVVASTRLESEPPKKWRVPSRLTSPPPPRAAGSDGNVVHKPVSMFRLQTPVVEKVCPPIALAGYPPAMTMLRPRIVQPECDRATGMSELT